MRELAETRNAVILAHNYQVPEVQDVADYVGDSLGLSQQAAATDADVIVFAGVHFMAETAAILAPDKTVLIPDLEAGCSLAASIDADALRRWKAENPDAVVVSYVNTTAEVKALSDYCCTCGNAQTVDRVGARRPGHPVPPGLVPGLYLERLTGRKMKIWPGECHVHAGIRPDDVTTMMEARPGVDLLIHPECGCASQCMYAAAHDAKLARTTHVLSTEGMVKHARRRAKQEFVVATETGILHRLEGGAGEAVLRDERARGLPLHEADHAAEGARHPARHATPRDGAARGRRAGPGRSGAWSRSCEPADPGADGRSRRGCSASGTMPCVCGFGLVEAAVGASRAFADHAPDEAVLVGAAGSYAPTGPPWAPRWSPPRCAARASASGEQSAAELGWTEPDVIELAGDGGQALSVAAASEDEPRAAGSGEPHPDAVAEEMEGFAVALPALLVRCPARPSSAASRTSPVTATESRWRLARR